jgi:hypothetical protein
VVVAIRNAQNATVHHASAFVQSVKTHVTNVSALNQQANKLKNPDFKIRVF